MSTAANDAIRSLEAPGLPFEELLEHAPPCPGSYAFRCDPVLLTTMPWDVPFEGKPLYVGKSESSLRSRDVLTHFGTGKTGWSTVRRSLAVVLDLHAAPRNATVPVRPANFGLTEESEERLTEWMTMHLMVATWVKPDGLALKPVETKVIKHWQPPLNLDEVDHPSTWLTNGRAKFADDVREQSGLPVRRR